MIFRRRCQRCTGGERVVVARPVAGMNWDFSLSQDCSSAVVNQSRGHWTDAGVIELRIKRTAIRRVRFECDAPITGVAQAGFISARSRIHAELNAIWQRLAGAAAAIHLHGSLCIAVANQRPVFDALPTSAE